MESIYFKISFLVGLISTIWNHINDCDETYNYLEPLGFISASNQSAFQTWEYSPAFSLRSYFYLWVFGWPAAVMRSLGLPGWTSFLAIRLFLALLSALSTSMLATAASRYLYPEDKVKSACLGMIFCAIHLLSPGFFISATSTVPSALSSAMTALMLATWINGQTFLSIGTVAFSGLVLWPFSACLGLPLALSCVINRKIMQLLNYSIIWAILLALPMLAIDSYYYGKFTFPTWNIIIYNALSSIYGHSLSQLYGTEPASFYVKNYFLNFNIVFHTVIVMAPIIFLIAIFKRLRNSTDIYCSRFLNLLVMTLLPFCIWNVVFFFQSHKEERFLFPCFPCLNLAAALILSTLFINTNDQKGVFSGIRSCLLVLFLVVFGLLSVMRILALIVGYNAPMFLTQHLPAQDSQTSKVLCLGRDWHYFPSQFLLPSGAWKVQFLKADFDGLLPGKFAENVGIISATRTPVSRFNDQNRAEDDRFYDERLCDFIIDRDSTPGKRERNYAADKKTWKMVMQRPILERTNLGSAVSPTHFELVLDHVKRSFFIPLIFHRNNTWVNMHILERI